MGIFVVMERLMRGGLQEVMVLIVSEMQRRGYDVTCFVAQPVAMPNPYLDALQQAGIPVVQGFAGTEAWARRLSLSRLLFWCFAPLLVPLALVDAWVRRRSPVRSIKGAYGKFRAAFVVAVGDDVEYFLRRLVPLAQLTALALRRRPRLVHVFFPEGVDRIRRWSAVMRLPMIFSDHSPYEREWHPPTRSLERALPRLDGLTVLDEPTAQRAQQVYRARCPVLVAPQPVPQLAPDWEVVPRAESAGFRIGCLARYDAGKGLAFLLRAMVEVCAKLPHAQLFLAGGGGLESELLALRNDLGLQERVEILGWVSGRDKSAFLANIDTLVLPSLMEGIPIAILEAMAAAKPVVATRVGAVHTAVVDGVTGLLVEPRDATGLAQALIGLGGDPELRARMGAAGRQRVKDYFSLEAAVNSMETFYFTVFKGSGAGSAQPLLKTGYTRASTPNQ